MSHSKIFFASFRSFCTIFIALNRFSLHFFLPFSCILLMNGIWTPHFERTMFSTSSMSTMSHPIVRSSHSRTKIPTTFSALSSQWLMRGELTSVWSVWVVVLLSAAYGVRCCQRQIDLGVNIRAYCRALCSFCVCFCAIFSVVISLFVFVEFQKVVC